jgi:hypothetical protein
LSEEEVDLARTFGAPRTLGVALRAAGVIAGGSRGEELLREAIELLSGPDSRLEQARALTDLGALLRRSNHRVDARHLLRRALDAGHHVGAGPVVERAETELRAMGRPRRVLLTGLEALTASERRIAELAAEGLTNREIAQSLFVTARTVRGSPHQRVLQTGCQDPYRITGRAGCRHAGESGLTRSIDGEHELAVHIASFTQVMSTVGL